MFLTIIFAQSGLENDQSKVIKPANYNYNDYMKVCQDGIAFIVSQMVKYQAELDRQAKLREEETVSQLIQVTQVANEKESEYDIYLCTGEDFGPPHIYCATVRAYDIEDAKNKANVRNDDYNTYQVRSIRGGDIIHPKGNDKCYMIMLEGFEEHDFAKTLPEYAPSKAQQEEDEYWQKQHDKMFSHPVHEDKF